MEITRRSVLAGVTALAATPAIAPSIVSAATSKAGKQSPGFYRYKVGDFEITQINDGARTFPISDGFVKNVSKDRVIAAARDAYMPDGMVTIPFNPMVVNTGSKLILIDTGYGPVPNTLLKSNMMAAGIDPKSIDIVIISHMHGDHINGLRDANNGLAFPNAEIKVPAVEWAFWMSDTNAAKPKDDIHKNNFANASKVFAGLADKVTRYDWGKEVAPGITAIDARGHTPGHTAFAVASGSARLLVQSDVTNIPELFFRNPEWHIGFDSDPVEAIKTRRKILDMAAAEKMTVAGFHFPFPAVGHVEKSGKGYRLIPIAWNPFL